jgi:hypothetical protein
MHPDLVSTIYRQRMTTLVNEARTQRALRRHQAATRLRRPAERARQTASGPTPAANRSAITSRVTQ